MLNSSGGVAETICTRCGHREVCSIKAECMSLIEERNNLRHTDNFSIIVSCKHRIDAVTYFRTDAKEGHK